MTETAYEIAISIFTLITIWLCGNKDERAPVMGVISELGWLSWIVIFEHWGLLPLCICLTSMYIRMYVKWRMK